MSVIPPSVFSIKTIQKMAKSKSIKIPEDVKEAILQRVQAFNKAHKSGFQVEFKGKFCYLSKVHNTFWGKGVETKLGRLTWTGDIDKWSFDVFKYSRETYDPNEFMFPGREDLDGTIEGAMQAGFKLYP
jgi:hypothetical protein